MDGKNTADQEGKPFSVLEKFRQLKKEKEQVPLATEEPDKVKDTPGTTVFQASGSPATSNGDFGRGGFRGRGCGRFGSRGGWRGKRRRHDDTTEKPPPPKRVAADLWRGQKESDVGITEYIRSGPGFEVILKQRYTDFQVHEIDLEGKIVRLTSTEIPKELEEKPTEVDKEALSPEEWATLEEIVEKKLASTLDKDVTDLSKEDRQRVHKAVKMRFGVHIYSNTNTVNDRKIMKMGYGTSKRYISRWPDGRPEYLHFVVLKDNCETSEAIGIISRHINVKSNKFGYAGTKDKRAVTTQQMCLRRTDAKRFKGCEEWRAIAVGNFCYKWNTLRLGDLRGNRFKLVLRNVKVGEDVISEAVESLKTVGFINYFGMQRFGQSALVPTHLVGQAILKGDWKLATELILKPRPGEAVFHDVKEAREVWWKTRDANEALKCLFRKERSIEGKILSSLKKIGPNAYQNAFDSLPRHTVTLYLHSYQSLVWNQVVSRRVRQFGLKVLPGDLVTSGRRDVDQLLYQSENAVESDASENEEEEDEDRDGCKIQVQVLSAEEAETASIYDVVYPLPGEDIRFPNNEIAEWYHEILQADGHSMASFGKVNKKYGMYGAYRKMLEKVEDLNWYIQRYSDLNEDLLLSDIEVLRNKPPPVSDPDGPYKAIVLEFNLKTCCYATMAIRELAKCETSVASQTKLTCQARDEDLASKKTNTEETEMMELDSQVDCDTTSNEVQSAESFVTKEINREEIRVKMENGEISVKAGEVEEKSNIKMQPVSDDTVNCDSTL